MLNVYKLMVNSKSKVFVFNTLAGWLDSSVNLISSFILNPIIVNTLGSYYFGVWQILFQLIGYLTAADLQPGTTLKWYVSKHKNLNDLNDISLKFSSTLFITLFSIPLYILFAFILTYFLPDLTKSTNENSEAINFTFIVLIVSFTINQFSFISKSLFVGMNLSYKRIGIQSISTISSALFAYLFLKLNYGIEGLAVAAVIGALLSLLAYFYLTRKVFQWLKVMLVKSYQLKEFISLNSGYLILKLSNLLNESFDIVLLAYFLGPTKVATYSLTYFSAKGLMKFIQELTTAVSPGLSISRSLSVKSFLKSRDTFVLINWITIGISVPLLVLLNENFISLWVGSESYLGDTENLFICLILILKLTRGIEVSIIAMTLKVKKMAFINIALSIIAILSSIVLTPIIGVNGLLISLIINLLLSKYLFFKENKKTIINYKSQFNNPYFMLTCIWIIITFLVSISISIPNNWIFLFSMALFCSFIIFSSYWLFLFDLNQKKYLLNILKKSYKK